MNRREFLGTATAATLLSTRLGWAFADHQIKSIGVQLYTVRDLMEKDFDGTVAKVAAIGYKEVELAGFSQASSGEVSYWKKSPKDVRASFDSHGLKSPSTHVSYASLEPANFAKVIEASKTIGNTYIVMPWIEESDRKNPDVWKKASAVFNRSGEACKKAGIQFCYHNHWFEFLPTNGKLPYDELLAECDPNLVKMELDLCWITTAGKDPIAYFNKYPGRFPLVHVKDIKSMPKINEGGSQTFGDSVDLTAVGSGMMDWKNLFGHAEKAGIKHYFVEHDRPTDPLASITSSYAYLSKLQF